MRSMNAFYFLIGVLGLLEVTKVSTAMKSDEDEKDSSIDDSTLDEDDDEDESSGDIEGRGDGPGDYDEGDRSIDLIHESQDTGDPFVKVSGEEDARDERLSGAKAEATENMVNGGRNRGQSGGRIEKKSFRKVQRPGVGKKRDGDQEANIPNYFNAAVPKMTKLRGEARPSGAKAGGAGGKGREAATGKRRPKPSAPGVGLVGKGRGTANGRKRPKPSAFGAGPEVKGQVAASGKKRSQTPKQSRGEARKGERKRSGGKRPREQRSESRKRSGSVVGGRKVRGRGGAASRKPREQRLANRKRSGSVVKGRGGGAAGMRPGGQRPASVSRKRSGSVVGEEGKTRVDRATGLGKVFLPGNKKRHGGRRRSSRKEGKRKRGSKT